MRVAALLELDGPSRGDSPDVPSLRVAARRWPAWVQRQPALRRVPGGLSGLRPWLRRADPADADEVLQALAALGSARGADDVSAAMVLAWALLPGASELARRLSRIDPRADEEVAAHLWLTIRRISPGSTRIAMSVLRDVRKRVLAELGAIPPLLSKDRWWADQVALAGPEQMVTWETRDSTAAQDHSAAEILTDLLTQALADGVISRSDASLLRDVVNVNSTIHGVRTRKGFAGLLSHHASAAVGTRQGISPRSVRRHTSRTVGALNAWLHATRGPGTPGTTRPMRRAAEDRPPRARPLGVPA